MGKNYYERARVPHVKLVARARDLVRFGIDGGLREKFVSRSWTKLRHEQADAVVRACDCPKLQADALISTVKRVGIDPSKVDWDQLQGADLSYDERLGKLEQMTGVSTRTTKEYELLQRLWQERRVTNG